MTSCEENLRAAEAALAEWNKSVYACENFKLKDENSRLRAALEFYADEDLWERDILNGIDMKTWRFLSMGGGAKAREALNAKP